MKFVAIKLKVEKDESRESAVESFILNVSELLANDVIYSSEGIVDSDSKYIFIGLKLDDNDLKDLIDAAPGNTFEIVDAQWPQFLKDKSNEGAEKFVIPDSKN